MHEMGGRPGAKQLLLAALHHIDLTSNQRSRVENAMHAMALTAPSARSVRSEIAAGIRAGKIDEAAVLAKFADARLAADRPALAASALDTLHATLTANQRRGLVTLVLKHIDNHGAEQEGLEPGRKGIVERLLSGLNLSGDQRASVARILAAPAPTEDLDQIKALRDQVRTQVSSFASDHFDSAACAASLKTTVDTVMRWHVRRTLHTLATILPVLDPAQRESLATRIENAPSHDDD